jgi:hypothetical protein
MGIANLRPSVIAEILEGVIPDTDHELYLGGRLDAYLPELPAIKNSITAGCSTIDERYRLYEAIFNNGTASLEFLAANILRGIIRAEAKGIEPSVFNLATWHNGGVQTHDEISKNKRSAAIQTHGNAVVRIAYEMVNGPCQLPDLVPATQHLLYFTSAEGDLITEKTKKRLNK